MPGSPCGDCFAFLVRCRPRRVQPDGSGLAVALQHHDKKAIRKFCDKLYFEAPTLASHLRGLVDHVGRSKPGESGRDALLDAVAVGSLVVATELVKAGICWEDHLEDLQKLAPAGSELEHILRSEPSKVRTAVFTEGLVWLPQVPLFQSLEPAEFPTLARAFTTRKLPCGEVVCRQGDVGEEFFVIRTGSAQVTVSVQGEEVPVRVLRAGDYFGELGLLNNAPRSATVTVLEQTELKVLSRESFQRLGLHRRLNFQKRKNIFLGCGEEVPMLQSASSTKTSEQMKSIIDGMLANEKFGPLLRPLPAELVEEIARSAASICVRPGRQVVRQGDFNADNFFIIESGTFVVEVDGKELPHRLGAGESFGELALLYRTARRATVCCVGEANTSAKLWVLSRQALRVAVQAPLRRKLEQFSAMLERVPLSVFGDEGSVDTDLLANALVEAQFTKGDFIFRRGDRNAAVYFLKSGIVALKRNGCKVVLLRGDGPEVPYFGQLMFQGEDRALEDVQVLSTKATVLVLCRHTVLAARGSQQIPQKLSPTRSVQYNYGDLRCLGLLGSGGFGAVYLVKSKSLNQTFALKKVSKGYVEKKQQQASILNEKRILQMTDCRFVVRMAATFSDEQYLMFLLEPALGGELFTVYQRHDLHGSERHARFYAGCVVKAFEHLHERHILYRDLKPENLLLDAYGYCKLTDFGLAKFVIGHTYTACGTPEYFAPELTLGMGHSFGVDWWTLGVLVYELMMGVAPFGGIDALQIFCKVQEGIGAVRFPRFASWTPFVRALCRHAAADRLGLRPPGIVEIFAHPWFMGFDWARFEVGAMAAPFRPCVTSQEDLRNFDSCIVEQAPYVDSTGSEWADDFECTRGPCLPPPVLGNR